MRDFGKQIDPEVAEKCGARRWTIWSAGSVSLIPNCLCMVVFVNFLITVTKEVTEAT